jgi:hypothetical protein
MSAADGPSGAGTSSSPILHCCDTWHALAREGRVIANRPEQLQTWTAIGLLHDELLRPLEEEFGVVVLTYGFAGPEMVKTVRQRAVAGGWLPNVSPDGDQHAGYELNSLGNRICERDGIAVDLHVPGRSSGEVRDWILGRLPFDWIYFYGDDRPLHLAWAPEPIGQVVEMRTTGAGKLMPKVVVKGRGG